MMANVETTKKLLDSFEQVAVQQISSGQNVHEDSLACLALAVPTEYRRTVAVEYLARPNIK